MPNLLPLRGNDETVSASLSAPVMPNLLPLRGNDASAAHLLATVSASIPSHRHILRI
ncbi:MAG: hypothetical protein Q8O92_03135 [Candidatus Latescibacter sp.]|nr:hypothetical protein [Candidatus Latescibacter sp.]